jgi:ubiquinone/menaquinone biosynthesis C-methylase UbiE
VNAYTSLAASYDRLTNDVAYAQILEFLEALLQAEGSHPETVLDLACGTGSMSILLAKKGYRVIGADMSEDMLTEAQMKADALEGNRPFFIRQRMEKLRLPEPVDCIVCCLDSLNYITDPDLCRQAIARAYRALKPGGIFLFDVNTPEKLRAMDGQIFLDEDDDVFCVWRGEFEGRICRYGIDLFSREGERWLRSFEEHLEYAYTPEELTQYLHDAGFVRVRVYGDRRMELPAEGEQRIYFSACKE